MYIHSRYTLSKYTDRSEPYNRVRVCLTLLNDKKKVCQIFLEPMILKSFINMNAIGSILLNITYAGFKSFLAK